MQRRLEPFFPDYLATAGALVRHAAAYHGTRDLIVADGRRLSFADLDARSAQLARGLIAAGVGKGTRVGLLAPNGPEWVISCFAAARLGAVVVLLNTYYQDRELRWILRHSDVGLLLTVPAHLGHDYLERLERIAPELRDHRDGAIRITSLPYLRSVWTWGEATPQRSWAGSIGDLFDAAHEVPDVLLNEIEAEVSPADPMVVIYSSGSTSDPKGAIHCHGPVVRHAHNLWPDRELDARDVIYTPMPMFWVGGFSFTLIAAIHAGVTLVFSERFDPAEVLDLIETERITQVVGWPHMVAAILEHPSFAGRDLSSLRAGNLLASGAGPAPLRANSLGMTETLGPHTFANARLPLPESKAGSFGLPVPGVEHRIIDPLTGGDVEPGQMGEIWVRGYSVMAGMHKREPSEVFTDDGWYRTGDAGWFDTDGHLFFKGRLGNQIKTAGVNVVPREVELVLEEQPEVSLALVAGVPHPDRGEDVVAAVVLAPGAAITGEELRARLRREIASYSVPRHIEVFTDRADLPWLDSGKLDLRSTAALLADCYRARPSDS